MNFIGFLRHTVLNMLSSPSYTQSNGQTERAVQTVKGVIRLFCIIKQCLYVGMFVYRATDGVMLKNLPPTSQGISTPKNCHILDDSVS